MIDVSYNGRVRPAAPARRARPSLVFRSTRPGRSSNLLGADLTARERDVVRLVLRGMTNRQIASELMVAPKTAINHVAHALDKLGATSRVQLVARAADLGLESLRG